MCGILHCIGIYVSYTLCAICTHKHSVCHMYTQTHKDIIMSQIDSTELYRNRYGEDGDGLDTPFIELWNDVPGGMCMVYGVWCMVYGVWCMVYGVWCMMCGVCGMMCGVLCSSYGVWYGVYIMYHTAGEWGWGVHHAYHTGEWGWGISVQDFDNNGLLDYMHGNGWTTQLMQVCVWCMM